MIHHPLADVRSLLISWIMDPKSVTMGESMLDQVIQGSSILDTKNHAVSTFVIQSGADDGRPLEFGHLSQVAYNGLFRLKGKTVPLTAAVELEPVLSETGNLELLMRGTFSIDLHLFDIDGADGPAPANHTLVFDTNFVLLSEIKK